MARTGYKVTVYLDDNPLSPTYMQTYEERVLDETSCPVSEDDLVLISNECEVSISGYTGYRLEIYYNRTTGEYVENRVLDSECEASSTEEQWVNSGSPYCETTEKGINTGYMLQLQVQMNPNLSNYGETRLQRYKSPECGGNNCAIWEDIQKQCHIEVIDCVATFDGTADISQIDNNPLSETYNQTRTINKQDSDCENCTQTTFSWVEVGTMCGDDELLCSNGIQQVSTNSYTVTQKYKTVGSKTIPMDEYQVVLKTEDDEDCGYIRPQYKMVKAEGQYLCDFETYTKYEMLIRMVSYDAGVTWSVWYDPQTGEPHTERGEVIAYDSYDCGKPMYRWVPNGEFTCEDNGDDGKIMIWNNEGRLSAYTPCNESDILSGSEVTTEATKEVYSEYTDTIQVGDCVRVVNGLPVNNKYKLWLGNYTEEVNGVLGRYERKSLDVPSRVNYFDGDFPTDSSYWNPYLRTMVFHSVTPPTLGPGQSMPITITSQPYGVTSGSGIFVPRDSYNDYLDAWSSTTFTNLIKPMNDDSVSYKAIIDYESDFTKWRCFVPDGESASTIGKKEWIYGCTTITGITLTNKVITVADNAFYISDNYTGMYNLKVIDLGDTVETIGTNAFKAGSSTVLDAQLDQVTLPSSLKLVKDRAFPPNVDKLYVNCTAEWQGQGISANTVYVPSINVLLNNTFSGLSSSFLSKSGAQLYIDNELITDLVIPSGTTSIGDYTFGLVRFNSVTIPEGVEVSSHAFGGLINDLYLNTPAYISPALTVHVPCGKLVEYNELYFPDFTRSKTLILEQDQCTDSPFRNITLYGVIDNGYCGDEDDYYAFRVVGDPNNYSRDGRVTFTITGKTLSLYYKINRGYYGSNAGITVTYNNTVLCSWNQDTNYNYVYYSENFDELSDGENTITVELFGLGTGAVNIGVPLNTSSQKRVIARLYQDDGTIVNVERASNLQVVTLKWANVESYSSTTSSITIYDCSGIDSGFNFDGMEKLQTLEFATPNPPSISTYQTSASTKPYRVIVPCEYYPRYMNSYSGMPFADRIESESYDCLEEEWIVEEDFCDASSGKKKLLERKYLKYGNDSYKTDVTRESYDGDCIEISNNGFTLDTDNTWNGHDSSTMSFKYLVDGGFTATIYQDYSTKYGIRGYVDIYDESGTKIATSYRNNGATVELESNKTYTVKHTELLAGGSGKIKFNY